MRHLLFLLALLATLPSLSQTPLVRFDAPARSRGHNPLVSALEAARTSRPRYAERTRGRRVEPLLQTRRHQGEPFNRSCPLWDGGERCIVGCVATCLEQVLTYYSYPDALADTLHGWATDHYTIPDILPATPIDWDHILADYSGLYTEQEAKAVADLSFYLGVAAHMDWGTESSGANMDRAAAPLRQAFGYKTVRPVYRWLYTPEAWNRLLRRELEAGRPICYTGHNMAMSGHAFNIDGVDEEGFYHLSWGYDDAFNGWFDLDYLNPFEPLNDPTPLGQQQGLFANQTALFLHPDALPEAEPDTLPAAEAYQGVSIDEVAFRRAPDTQAYTIADCRLTNHTSDTLYFTFEALTYLPSDTARFLQGDYVAITSVRLAPAETRTWPLYCQFMEPGERTFGLSSDDETFLFEQPVSVAKGTPSRLTFGPIDATRDDSTATFTLDITNEARSGMAGDLITYCLFEEGQADDTRHCQVLSLAAGETTTDTIVFRRLRPEATYTLLVRHPWPVQQTYTLRPTAIGKIQDTTHGADGPLFDLAGRRLPEPRGLFIKNKRKLIKP